MFTAATWATIGGIGAKVGGAASLIGGGVGAGMSYFGQKAAAKTQATMGQLNAEASAQQAMLEARQQMWQSKIQAAGAKAQSRSAFNNAVGMQEQVEADSRIATTNIRRSRDEFTRGIGAMRAQGSENGLLETTGSPLDLLTKAAEDQQLFEAEQRWVDENSRRSGFRAAAVERARGTQLGLNAALYQLEAKAALAAGRQKVAQAQMTGYGEQARADGMRREATAGLISSVAGLGASGYNMWQNRTPKTSLATKS